jgi:hypothetical protein
MIGYITGISVLYYRKLHVARRLEKERMALKGNDEPLKVQNVNIVCDTLVTPSMLDCTDCSLRSSIHFLSSFVSLKFIVSEYTPNAYLVSSSV